MGVMHGRLEVRGMGRFGIVEVPEDRVQELGLGNL